VSDAPTPVTIFGRTYHLRGDGDPAYLNELAQEVDRRMREVAEATGTADTMKVAILAALNLTDECLQAQSGALSKDMASKMGQWVARIDDVLEDPGCRPNRAGHERADGNA
jgi:cell division protein ZapA